MSEMFCNPHLSSSLWTIFRLVCSGGCRGRRGDVTCQLAVSLLLATDTGTPHTNMEISYCSTFSFSSSSSSSLARYGAEKKSTEVFWGQYKRGRKSLSLWRLFKLIFSKQEARQNDALDRTDSLHRFYEELYHRQNSRLQSTLLRADSSIMADISDYQSYNQEEGESLYYVPFC